LNYDLHQKNSAMNKGCGLVILLLLLSGAGNQLAAQRYLADYDSSLFIRDTLRPFLKRMENLHFSGYIQPQFQVAQSKGAPSYEGGNFQPNSNNRFMLRRARIKVDYILPNKAASLPRAVFTFQFDATERGVFARDVFLRLFLDKKNTLSIASGLLARPFGYEVNLSSAYRESPERGRMSQILMPAERDLGAMLTIDPHASRKNGAQLKLDAGFFNGQGLSGTADFDSYKDLISRLTLKRVKLSPALTLSSGLSLLYGGWMQATKYVYKTEPVSGGHAFKLDSTASNLGEKAPRHYYGADMQLVYQHGWGKTELRGEYWQGLQPGTSASTVNPGELPLTPTYIREFRGTFIYFLQNIINEQWEVIAKYDFYDPNKKVSGTAIGQTGTGFTAGDIRYDTYGFGLTHYLTNELKVVAYFDKVRNETTSVPGFTSDAADNTFTLRLQLRF
jgi:hypothetical protein